MFLPDNCKGRINSISVAASQLLISYSGGFSIKRCSGWHTGVNLMINSCQDLAYPIISTTVHAGYIGVDCHGGEETISRDSLTVSWHQSDAVCLHQDMLRKKGNVNVYCLFKWLKGSPFAESFNNHLIFLGSTMPLSLWWRGLQQ